MNKIFYTICVFAAIHICCSVQGQELNASLIPKKGLWIKSEALAWGMGSEINFLDADRKHHEYYFTWWEQDADTSHSGKDILWIGSKNTAVNGDLVLTNKKNNLSLALNCTWNKTTQGVCDILYLKIWTPFFKNARWFNNTGKEITAELESFSDTTIFAKTPFGEFQFCASAPFQFRREENIFLKETDFSARSQFLYLEEKNIKLNAHEKISRTFSIKQIGERKGFPIANKDTTLLNSFKKKEGVWQPITGKMTLLPRPSEWAAEEGELVLPISKTNPTDSLLTEFNKIVKKYWQVDNFLSPIIHAKKEYNLAPEAYSLRISTTIDIGYASKQGLQHAIESLGQLVYQKNGSLVLRHSQINDHPKIDWRGIHMFTGPTSWALHKKMFENVLLPLKINKAVLQCEQAKWKSFPSIHNSISIGLDDLKNEFSYLRSKQVEPIPLIQSLGHMEWFFKPMDNRTLAINPSYPYTLNVFKPEATKAMYKIWEEAIALLKPQTIHVGFDEIGMIGFNWPREKEVELFRKQIKWLSSYTKKKELSLMIWGDMGLAPGEGPDACNGVNENRAAQIRKLIPPKTWVADWHYLGNPDPTVYRKNLSIWKNGGHQPLASPWFIGDNIRGFTLAALEQKAGVLQTTWADFESSELNMLKNIEQFGAYVLALDYSWSGRNELPRELPYEPIQEFTNRFYRQSLPPQSSSGWTWNGDIHLKNCTDTTNHSINKLNFELGDEIRTCGIKLLAETQVILPESTPVAILQLYSNNVPIYETTLLYGRDARATQDPRPIYKRIPERNKHEWVEFLEAGIRIDKIVIKSLHPATGLMIKEFSLID